MLALAACQNEPESPTPVNAAPSTPISQLVVSATRDPDLLPTALPAALIAEADAEYLLLTNIFERVSPSVVSVEVLLPSAIQPGLLEQSRGSGFIWDRNGHIITNAHVVNDAEAITITFSDGYLVEAEVVGVDLFSDLAVVAVDVPTTRLIPLEMADSDQVRVGERAIAIGNPFGLTSSMTVGIVSGVGRQLRSAELLGGSEAFFGFQNPDIIQVDAQINPGSSGGPLLNSQGQVIGVNTAIRTESGIFEGVGLAVPSNTLQRVAPELIETGRVDYSWLGISSDSTLGVTALAEPLGLPVQGGVLISSVTPGSPAAEAGLRGGEGRREVFGLTPCVGGDIIVAIDGETVRNFDELVAYLVVNTRPGDSVTLTIVRDRETYDLEVVLRERPRNGSPGDNCGPSPD
jgi:2-alkenal reductase